MLFLIPLFNRLYESPIYRGPGHYGEIIVELKAVSELTPQNESQLINYLKATGLKVGLLVNFGERSLKYQRFVL